MKPRALSVCGAWMILSLALPLLTIPWTAARNAAYILNTEKHFPPAWPRVRSISAALNAQTYAQITRVLDSLILPRGAFIAAKKNLEYYLLREPRLGGVDRGRGGWLFLRETYNRFWDSPERTRHAVALLADFRARLPRPHARWRVLIAPSKYTLYPEKMRPAALALANRFSWHHDVLAATLAREGSPEARGVWDDYRREQARNEESLFYAQDTHHTPLGALVLIRSLADSLSPELWNQADVRVGGWETRRGDLAELAGVWLPPDRARRRWIERPGQAPPICERSGPVLDWGARERYRSTPGIRPLWPGRTLIAHDSMLKEYRGQVAGFFQDVTFVHYKDLIGGGRFSRALADYDTLVLEIGERNAVDILERLFQPLAAALPVRTLAPAALAAPQGGARILARPAARTVLEIRKPETLLRLPGQALDPRQGYLLGLQVTSPRDTWCRLYRHHFSAGGRTELCYEEKVLWAGENQVYYYLAPGDAWYPPELDVYMPGQYAWDLLTYQPLLNAPVPNPPLSRWTTIWRKSGLEWPVQLEANDQARLHPAPGALWIESLGDDPQILLAAPPLEARGPWTLSLTVWSSADSLAQVFFQTADGQALAESRSQTRQLVLGENRLTFVLPAQSAGRILRFDPGCRPGWYGVNLISYGPEKPGSGASERARLLLPPVINQLPEAWLANAQGNGQAQLTRIGSRLSIQASGTDPGVLLPPASQRDLAGEFRFRLTAPSPTLGQLFYQTGPGQPFTETNSLSFTLKTGLNQVRVPLPPGAGGWPLRLDPGCHPGAYEADHFEFQEAQTERIGPGYPQPVGWNPGERGSQ